MSENGPEASYALPVDMMGSGSRFAMAVALFGCASATGPGDRVPYSARADAPASDSAITLISRDGKRCSWQVGDPIAGTMRTLGSVACDASLAIDVVVSPSGRTAYVRDRHQPLSPDTAVFVLVAEGHAAPIPSLPSGRTVWTPPHVASGSIGFDEQDNLVVFDDSREVLALDARRGAWVGSSPRVINRGIGLEGMPAPQDTIAGWFSPGSPNPAEVARIQKDEVGVRLPPGYGWEIIRLPSASVLLPTMEFHEEGPLVICPAIGRCVRLEPVTGISRMLGAARGTYLFLAFTVEGRALEQRCELRDATSGKLLWSGQGQCTGFWP